MKRIISIMLMAAILLLDPISASAQTLPYDTYNYDYQKNVVPTPAAYIPEQVIHSTSLECGKFNSPKDMFITEDGTIYVADTGNHRIVVLNSDMTLNRVVASFDNKGTQDKFNGPSGLYCSPEGVLYIADTENKRVVILDAEGKLIDIIQDPQSEVLPEDFDFAPLKVSVDYAGRVYVVAKNIFQGVVKKNASDKQVMIVTRITLLAIAVIAMLFALDENSVIFNIVSFAWAGFGATFGPLMLFSLFWKRTTRAGAIAGMLSGGIMVFVWKLAIRPLGGVWNIYELLPAFIISCIFIVVVSLCTAPPSNEVQEEFDRVAGKKAKV